MNVSELTKDLRICDDYLQFQNHLKELRRLDDLIINTLNTTVLTATFRSQGSDASKQCQRLGDEVCIIFAFCPIAHEHLDCFPCNISS